MPADLDALCQSLATEATPATVSHGLVVVEVPAAAVQGTARRLKDALGFDMLLDVTAVDWLPREPRFDEVWENDDGKTDFASCHSFKRKYGHALQKPKGRAR